MANENLDNRTCDWTDIEIYDENSNGNSYVKNNLRSKSQTNLQICQNLEEMKNKEFENMKQKLKVYRKRVECLLKMNCQLQSELNQSIQANCVMEQRITCPYIIEEGEMEFPGKKDLEKRFDWMFTTLTHVKNDLKTVQNNNYLVHELDNILRLSLLKCYDNCPENVDKNKIW